MLETIFKTLAFGISEMSDEEEAASQLTDKQKIEIAKWFLLNSPAGEIQYVAKGNPTYSLICTCGCTNVCTLHFWYECTIDVSFRKMLGRYEGGFAK